MYLQLSALVTRFAVGVIRRSCERGAPRIVDADPVVQGTRDRLCPLSILESVRREMTAANELHVVEGGDHSLLVAKSQLKASGETQDGVDQRILEAIHHFVASNRGHSRRC